MNNTVLRAVHHGTETASQSRHRANRQRVCRVNQGEAAEEEAVGPCRGAVRFCYPQQHETGAAFSWRAIFAINLPLGALALVLAATALRDHDEGEPGAEPTRRHAFDVPGFVLSMAGFTTLVYGLTEEAGAKSLLVDGEEKTQVIFEGASLIDSAHMTFANHRDIPGPCSSACQSLRPRAPRVPA